jgi:hypothetical protein
LKKESRSIGDVGGGGVGGAGGFKKIKSKTQTNTRRIICMYISKKKNVVNPTRLKRQSSGMFICDYNKVR